MELTERDRRILDFERTWFTRTGPKADAIRVELELSSTRYYELLNQILDTAAAEAYDPLVVRRLRRHRDRRRRARFERGTPSWVGGR